MRDLDQACCISHLAVLGEYNSFCIEMDESAADEG